MSLKSYVGNLLNRWLNNSDLDRKLDNLGDKVQSLEHAEGYVDKGTQLLLRMQYRQAHAAGESISFDDIDFRNHSQTGEDGILWYIFSMIGTETKKSIEICAGNGKECNTANLIVNHGWHALLVDGDETKVAIANQYYREHPGTRLIPPRVVREWVTAENVNEIIEENVFHGDVDLLSLDLDGIDYWIWKAISCASPRVVVLEVQAVWGCSRAVTVPYRPDFKFKSLQHEELGVAWYAGASLPAFIKLANEKGYRLIGANRYGFNVFFMRNDVGVEYFPEIEPEQVFSHPVAKWANERARPLYNGLEWQDV